MLSLIVSPCRGKWLRVRVATCFLFCNLGGGDDMGEKKNKEGYEDYTAYLALKNIESEKRAGDVLRLIKYAIKLSGLELVDEIKLYDPKTGKTY